MIRSLYFGLLALLLTACAADEPPEPPKPLKPIQSEIKLRQAWSVSTGDKDKRGSSMLTPWQSTDCLWTASVDGSVRCFDAQSGKLLKRFKTGVALLSGISGFGNQLYMVDRDGNVIALNASDGLPVWQYAMGSEVLAPVAAAEDIVVVRSSDGRVVALSPDDGSELWVFTYTPPSLTLRGYATPLVLGNGILVGLDDGRIAALDKASGSTVWESVVSYPTGGSEVERLVDIDASMLIDDQFIYAVNYQGNLVRLEPSQGRVTWSLPMSSTAGIAQSSTALVVVDSASEVVSVDKQSGEVLWRQKAFKGRRLTSPVIVENRILVGDLEGYVHVIALNDGHLSGRFKTGEDRVMHVVPTRRDSESETAGGVVSAGSVLVQTRDAVLRRMSW